MKKYKLLTNFDKSKRKAYEFLANLAQFDDWKLDKAEDVFGNPLPDCLALYISREDYENTYKVETFHCSAILMGQEWWDEGVSIRIPASHVLEKTGEVDKYGTPIYKNEKHSFAVVARKGESETDSTNSFILWDMASNDVHYRVIHEN